LGVAIEDCLDTSLARHVHKPVMPLPVSSLHDDSGRPPILSQELLKDAMIISTRAYVRAQERTLIADYPESLSGHHRENRGFMWMNTTMNMIRTQPDEPSS
jgi:hypothetical protein